VSIFQSIRLIRFNTFEMSSEKYERPVCFPAWVDSAEDDALVVEAEALGASEHVFTSKANCEKFVTTKRSFSAPPAGKY
jgi:hypothetical protein